MKSSDYIVRFFSERGISHFFGYQGTMIAHFVDSVQKSGSVTNHCCYNEQGAGFAAVGSAKATGRPALAYATSGPGACNLISAVADAYYDSAPVIFITGQLNTYEYLHIDGIRQNGFQEMDVVSAMQGVTKYCTKVEDISDLRYILEKAFDSCVSGRPGPVVIDLPMDMQRQEIDPLTMRSYDGEKASAGDSPEDAAKCILEALKESEAPVLVLGNGIPHGSREHEKILRFAEKHQIPVITSMLGRDLLTWDDPLNFGHLGGGYGHRYANIIAYKKADLIVSLGCSLCKRQTAMRPEKFAADAGLIRVEIDPLELQRKVHEDETGFLTDAREVISVLDAMDAAAGSAKVFDAWMAKCSSIREKLSAFDDVCPERKPNEILRTISGKIPEDTMICCDVGQHQVWTSQSFQVKKGQRLLFSGGHGAMGFALPASIGAHYGTGQNSVAVCGDGAFQMNIQELQWVFREQVPVTMVVLNNHSLGLIQQQQDDIFDGLYAGSMESGGYTSPDFAAVAKAYGIDSCTVSDTEQLGEVLEQIDQGRPHLIQVQVDTDSRAYPKTYFGEEMYNQRPYIPEELMKEILDM